MAANSARTPPELRGIRKRLFDRFSDSVATGLRTHPFLTTKGHALLEEARVLAPRLSRRGTYAAGILRSVLATEGTYASAVLLTNHALQLLVPDFALLVEEAIQEAKFRVGAASSNVEDPMEEILRSPGGLLIFGGETVGLGLAFGEASRGLGEDAYGKIRDLGLDDFDAPEDSVAGLPRIERSTGGELVFRLPCLRRDPEPIVRGGGCHVPLSLRRGRPGPHPLARSGARPSQGQAGRRLRHWPLPRLPRGAPEGTRRVHDGRLL
jgi:hypothetical protein